MEVFDILMLDYFQSFFKWMLGIYPSAWYFVEYQLFKNVKTTNECITDKVIVLHFSFSQKPENKIYIYVYFCFNCTSWYNSGRDISHSQYLDLQLDSSSYDKIVKII